MNISKSYPYVYRKRISPAIPCSLKKAGRSHLHITCRSAATQRDAEYNSFPCVFAIPLASRANDIVAEKRRVSLTGARYFCTFSGVRALARARGRHLSCTRAREVIDASLRRFYHLSRVSAFACSRANSLEAAASRTLYPTTRSRKAIVVARGGAFVETKIRKTKYTQISREVS